MSNTATLTPLEQKWKDAKDLEGPELDDAYVQDTLDPTKLTQTVLDRVPRPTGWRIAVLPYLGAEKSKGGIVMAEQTRKLTQLTTTCAYVLKVGELAYADSSKYPSGPWCKEGDWVIFARYGGARLSIDGGEIRILNDDEILAVVNDPEDVLHL